MCKALGYKHLTCEQCVAKEYGKDVEEVRDIMEDFFGIKKRMGAVDCVKAVQLAKLFYGASSQAGSRNISNG